MKKKLQIDPVVELFESLPRIRVSQEGPYTFQDRSQDFLAVFGGTSNAEQGARVLAQISQICDPLPTINDADKPGTLAFKNGMRRVMSEIILCMAMRGDVKIERQRE